MTAGSWPSIRWPSALIHIRILRNERKP